MEHRGWYRRRLPHFDQAELIQMVTFCLSDAMPVIANRASFREQESQLDQGAGACWMQDPFIADLVAEAITRRDGTEYSLHSWVVMPNHVHLLLQQREGHPLGKVMQHLKGWTGHAANKYLGRHGHFWLPEYWDRYLRHPDRAGIAGSYIEDNPVAAGFVEAPHQWRWSSAFVREYGGTDLTVSGPELGVESESLFSSNWTAERCSVLPGGELT